MKHINLTNWRGSITDWTKLNYIYGGLDDSYAVKGNLRIDKDNYNYVEYREGYNKFNFNENVVSVNTGTSPLSIILNIDDDNKTIQAKTTDSYSRAIIKLSEDLITGETYTFSFNLVTNVAVGRIALSSTGSHIDERDYGFLSSVTSGSKTLTFTAVNNKLYLHLYLCTAVNNNCDMTMSNIMLNNGSTALTYEPYFEGKKYVITENLGIVDLGTLTYTLTGTGQNTRFRTTISDIAGQVNKSTPIIAYSKIYTAVTYLSTREDMTMYYDQNTTGTQSVGFKNDSYNDATLFKTAMSGEMLTYKLKDPVIEVVE